MTKNHEQELLDKTVKRFVEEELYPHEEIIRGSFKGGYNLNPLSFKMVFIKKIRIKKKNNI